MKILHTVSAVFCIAAVTTIFPPAASAQFEQGDYNRKTTVTFSAPVEIPGVHLKGYRILPAGSYVFKLADSTTNRHIVQIQSADESKTYATILAIPNTRVKRTDKTVITFRERPDGDPPALRAWFYPDAAWGDEFVYPKSRAKELAQGNDTPVLYNSNEDTAPEVTEPIQPPDAPAVAEMDAAPVMAYNPTGDEIELAQAVTPPVQTQTRTVAAAAPAPMPAPVPSPEPAELPHTAGQFGSYLAGGFLALVGALSLRRIAQRV